MTKFNEWIDSNEVCRVLGIVVPDDLKNLRNWLYWLPPAFIGGQLHWKKREIENLGPGGFWKRQKEAERYRAIGDLRFIRAERKRETTETLLKRNEFVIPKQVKLVLFSPRTAKVRGDEKYYLDQVSDITRLIVYSTGRTVAVFENKRDAGRVLAMMNADAISQEDLIKARSGDLPDSDTASPG